MVKLPAAMMKYSEVFVFLSMVEAARSVVLDVMMERLAIFRKESNLERKIKGQQVYPIY